MELGYPARNLISHNVDYATHGYEDLERLYTL